MIKNERQLNITRTQIESFKNDLAILAERKKTEAVNDLLEVEATAIRNQIKNLESQIAEYNSLWGNRTQIPELRSFDEIPDTLIRARLSLGLSQKELGERLGVKEQQIQRYEATGYESASLGTIKEIATALNVTLAQDVTSRESVTFGGLLRKLRDAGLETRFLVDHLLPEAVANELEDKSKNSPIDRLGIQVAEQVSQIYGWTSNEIFGTSPLEINLDSLGTVRFKTRKGTNTKQMAVYTFYTHYLALLILQASENLPIARLATNPYEVRKGILANYGGSLTLQSALRYVWHQGVPVLSLHDKGAFQGAYFREQGRSIIILKQRTTSHSRWLFDLFHEFWHAAQHQDDPNQKLFEAEDLENLAGSKSSEEEKKANLFAGAVLLGRPAGALVQECLKEADNDLRKLKTAVQNVAKRQGVSVDVLANCVAFKLSEVGENWWGVASNLQETTHDIQDVAQDILLENVDLSKLNSHDFELLRRALTPEPVMEHGE